jgi:phytoene dehydrogenase-like protein
MEAVVPGFTDSIVGREVIGPDTMQGGYGLIGGNIFDGELNAVQMFHCRLAAGYAGLCTPVKGLYQGRLGDPRRWWCDRNPGP